MKLLFSLTTLVAGTLAASLADVCTTSYVKANLPEAGSIAGITINASTVMVAPVYNASASAGMGAMSTTTSNTTAATFNYCNVTFAYTHNGRNDKVWLWYWFPEPTAFKSRYLATGGGGFMISSGSSGFADAINVGAVSGTTDGGFGGFSKSLNTAFLIANGTINYQALYMFGYQAIGEATIIGKSLAAEFYNTTSKIYTYYSGCSEGGREGWSQVQRYPTEYDGVIAGAPAMRFAHQQVQHLYGNVVEKTLNYYPSPCELSRIVNATIEACDKLDGIADGVVSRTDLCKLSFDFNTTVGLSYSCAAAGSSGGAPGGSPPSRIKRRQMSAGGSSVAQNGTVTQQAAEVAKLIYAGLHNSDGERAYISYQYTSAFGDAATTYNNQTGKYELSIASSGGGYVARYLQLRDADNLSNLDNVTYDTLVDWMEEGWKKYEDTLQTTWTDLTDFRENGGKILHYHGESDSSVPAGSSVIYHESVRKNMYPNETFDDAQADMAEWYRLFLIPGAEHCGANSLQPNGPYPQGNLATMINWVEGDIEPVTLTGTVSSTSASTASKGKSWNICAWPLRPMWDSTGNMNCTYDQKSFDTWVYEFDAFKEVLN